LEISAYQSKQMQGKLEESSAQDDILYLLHLEALKRYFDESRDMHRQVEEQTRVFLEAKQEYTQEFRRLVSLRKQVLLCEALDAKQTPIDDSQVKRTLDDLARVGAKLASDQRPIALDARTLDDCKSQLLAQHKPRRQLAKQQLNIAENRETLSAVCSSLENVEGVFETATLLAIDHFSGDMRPPPEETP
ncbi:hypothetical protein KR222_011158, partial [Zaprionus bogoriensis]